MRNSFGFAFAKAPREQTNQARRNTTIYDSVTSSSKRARERIRGARHDAEELANLANARRGARHGVNDDRATNRSMLFPASYYSQKTTRAMRLIRNHGRAKPKAQTWITLQTRGVRPTKLLYLQESPWQPSVADRIQ